MSTKKVKKMGRPSLTGEAMIAINGRGTAKQHAKFLKLGGSAWLREVIDAADLPVKKAKPKPAVAAKPKPADPEPVVATKRDRTAYNEKRRQERALARLHNLTPDPFAPIS